MAAAEPTLIETKSEVPEQIAAAFRAFDRANGRDPNVEEAEGAQVPRELAYARRMSRWLERLYPEASDALQLAARSQHIERWSKPRSSYPDGRVGYLTWRRDLARYHAERAGTILGDLGFEAAEIARVQALLRKERLKQDPEAQALEDVACLVFLAHYFAPFARRHSRDKVCEIIRKTWRKMSDRGRQAALELEMEPEIRSLILGALEKTQMQPDNRPKLANIDGDQGRNGSV